MSQPELPDIDALLHIPQLSVQNANAISGLLNQARQAFGKYLTT